MGKGLQGYIDINERSSRVLSEIAGASSRRDRFLHVGRLLRVFYDELPDDRSKREFLGKVISESGIGIRTAIHWMEIDRVYAHLGVPIERLASIGWAKLTLLKNHIRETGDLGWLVIAETYSIMELKRIVHGVTGPRRSMLLTFSASDYVLVVKALVLLGATLRGGGRHLMYKEEALLRICRRVLDSQRGTTGKQDAEHEGV